MKFFSLACCASEQMWKRFTLVTFTRDLFFMVGCFFVVAAPLPPLFFETVLREVVPTNVARLFVVAVALVTATPAVVSLAASSSLLLDDNDS
jgi:uncharacterized membrane protein YkvI